MVDPLRVQTMLDRLGREIAALHRLARRPAEELLGDEDILSTVKYRFVVAIEVCIDVGRHLVASEGLRAPRDYADVFTVLSEAGLLAATRRRSCETPPGSATSSCTATRRWTTTGWCRSCGPA